MPLSKQQLRQIALSARQVGIDEPAERFEDFVARILGLNQLQVGQLFPAPDPAGTLAIAIAAATNEREKLLRAQSTLPSFAVFNDIGGVPQIAGFCTYLASKGLQADFLGRLRHHDSIRRALRRIRQGHNLEALAAAIMNERCDYGEATRGSGDQGIDAVGWKELLFIEPSFADGGVGSSEVLPGEKVFLFASSKAAISAGSPNDAPKLINPAHIRELVGGWVIQRSAAGIWRKLGIRMLSPVQMVLVTTYRISTDAKAECRSLGVQVWGIPELIYLICVAAPAAVFDAQNAFTFSARAFRTWWKQRDATRLMAA